jgi:DNA-binding FrmR family transcriptional regulator
MVEEGEDGLAIAQQMQAVVKAIEKAKQLLILDHIAYHLDEIAGPSPEAQARLTEFREITKYL